MLYNGFYAFKINLGFEKLVITPSRAANSVGLATSGKWYYCDVPSRNGVEWIFKWFASSTWLSLHPVNGSYDHWSQVKLLLFLAWHEPRVCCTVPEVRVQLCVRQGKVTCNRQLMAHTSKPSTEWSSWGWILKR